MDPTKRKQDELASEETSIRSMKKVKYNSNAELADLNASNDSPTNPSPSSNTLGPHELLDFSALEDEAAISSRFDAVARALMHEYRLVVGRDDEETAFEIQEMEFYLQKAVCHEDPFTHGSEEQKVSGRWYFHRAPRRSADASRNSTSLTSYRSGTRKGLDLTIGGPLPRTFSSYFGQTKMFSASSDVAEQGSGGESEVNGLLRGGILLRSLRELPKDGSTKSNSKSSSVYGPSLLVDKILALSGASSIPELVENMWGGDTNAFSPPNASSSARTSYLYLEHATRSASMLPQIHKSPRIGLDLSHPGIAVPNIQSTLIDYHPRVRFLPKMYRYFTRPEELTKGRQQTFYGFIHTTLQSRSEISYRSLCGDKDFRAILAAGMGLKDTLVGKYLAEYDAGKKEGLKHLKSCIGPNGKGAADSATLYLKMMGAIDAVLLFSPARTSASESL